LASHRIGELTGFRRLDMGDVWNLETKSVFRDSHSKRFPMLTGLVGLLVTLLIVGLIFAVVWWIIGLIPWPAPPNPLGMIVRVIVAVIFLLILLSYLVGYLPAPAHGSLLGR